MRFRPLAVLLVLFVTLIFLCGCFSDEPQGLHTRFMHKLSIKTTTPIENVTFLVPVPTRDDMPAIGRNPISDAFYVDRLPEHYDCTIIAVDGQYYLQLTAPQMDPARPIHVDYYNYTSFGDTFRPEVIPQLRSTKHWYPSPATNPWSSRPTAEPHTDNRQAPQGLLKRVINPGCRYSSYHPRYAYYEKKRRIENLFDIWGEKRVGLELIVTAGMLKSIYY